MYLNILDCIMASFDCIAAAQPALLSVAPSLIPFTVRLTISKENLRTGSCAAKSLLKLVPEV